MDSVGGSTLPAGKRWPLALVVGGSAVLLVAAIIGWAGSQSSGPAVAVDFHDVVGTSDGAVVGEPGEKPPLRMAVAAMISPQTTRECYDDLLRLIAGRVGREAVFVQRKTYAEIYDLVERREVDVAFVCTGPYVTGHEKFGMELLVVPVVHGQAIYYSYVLAGRDSAAHSLADLRGGRFAFTDPESNTGCTVPRFMLAQRGETPESFFGETFFTHSHDNSIQAVAEGLADGAAVDSLIWDFMNATDNRYTSRTRIVEKSPPYGIPPVVVHPALDEALKGRLRQVFLGLHEDAAALPLLRRLQIDRFEKGADGAYDSVRAMQRWLAENRAEP